jgi:hypothetical protein
MATRFEQLLAIRHVAKVDVFNYKGRQVYVGGRGKYYVLGSTGRPIYTVRMEKPVRKTRKNKNVKRGPRHLPRNVNLFLA